MNHYKVALYDQTQTLVFSDAEPELQSVLKQYIHQPHDNFNFIYNQILYQVEKNSFQSQTLFKIFSSPDYTESPQVVEMLLAAIEQSYEGVIITDALGKVVFMNENYAHFLNVDRRESIGKHVTQVIQNTRMHIVTETRKAEIGVVWKHNNKALIVSRFPFFKNGKLFGTIGFIMFQTTLELRDLIKKVEDMEKKLEYYKNNIYPTHQVKYTFDDFFTQSPAMKLILDKAKKIASTPSNVVITGESGTGKELLAHSIHHYSYRKDAPFVSVNCSAIPNDLFESELFGYAEGAFTGAKKGGKAGKFELANNGTLFLDEVAEIPFTIQSKLLRVIQERELERVGANQTIPVDIRIIAATNKDLLKLVEKGLFREDLYYRLNVFHITLPPLRERKEDIEGCLNFFLQVIEKESGKKIQIDPAAIEIIRQYSWPGNLRELKNLIEMLTGLLEGDTITKDNLPIYLSNCTHEHPHLLLPNFINHNQLNYKTCLQHLEKELILCALKQTGGQKKEAAQLLGIARSLLYKKIKELSIQEDKTFA